MSHEGVVRRFHVHFIGVSILQVPVHAGVVSMALNVGARDGSVKYGWTVLAIALVATVAGLLLSVRMLNPVEPAPQSGFGIGDDVRTSFGIVAVEFVRSVDGVTHRALAGANHGVSGYVDEGQQQIQVAVALTNRRNQPLTYSVRQFELLATVSGKTTTLQATAGDLPNGRILPDAGVEGHLDFTLPAGSAALTLHFNDPGGPGPIVIDLGSISATHAPGPAHSHG
jgi:hypothetical protein